MAACRRIDPEHPDAAIIHEAAEGLRSGGLVVLPTDTVYGIAADPRIPGSVERIFEAKQRPAEKEIPFLVEGLEAIESCAAVVSPCARRLADRFWPGPLTLVLPMPGGGWQGFRIPRHAVALAVLHAVGGPLAVTSANRSGQPPACTAEVADGALGDHVALILDAGPSPGGFASSVVRVELDHATLVREGAIPWAAIEWAILIQD